MEQERAKATLTLEDIMGGTVPPYLTARQVGKIFQINPSTVRKGCEAGKYEKAFKLGNDWRVPSRFLEKQIRQAEERGEFAA
jgi:hypothetical protein